MKKLILITVLSVLSPLQLLAQIQNYIAGDGAGKTNTGSYNTFIGVISGNANTTGSFNTFIGRASGRSNTTGIYNVFLGQNSGWDNTTGKLNTFLGQNSGRRNTIGIENTFVGQSSGCKNVSGSYNTFIGKDSGFENTSGKENTFIGQNSGHNNTGSHNVFLGNKSGYNETGSNKLYIENSDSATPLIYGEFDTDKVKINGSLHITQSLRVDTGISAKELRVELNESAWPDYVFSADYQLPSLESVASHIKEKKHLPGIPSTEEVERNGLSVSAMMTKQMQKIEELTLYLIEMKKENEQLKQKNTQLQKETAILPSILQRLQALEKPISTEPLTY